MSKKARLQNGAPQRFSDTLGIDVKDSEQSQKIRRAAAALFAAKGYHAVGVAELGEATGMGRGALYHHIGSKEELLYDISSRYMFDLVRDAHGISETEKEPVSRIKLLSQNLMEAVSRNLPEMKVCFREIDSLNGEHHRFVSKAHADYQAVWERAINDGVQAGTFRAVDKIAVKGLLGMYFYSFLWLNPDGKHSATNIGEVFADLVLHSLRVK